MKIEITVDGWQGSDDNYLSSHDVEENEPFQIVFFQS